MRGTPPQTISTIFDKPVPWEGLFFVPSGAFGQAALCCLVAAATRVIANLRSRMQDVLDGGDCCHIVRPTDE
jgi:hypothetical protein